MTFLALFFLIFYLVFLSYKLLLKEKFRIDDILFLLINSGMLYIIGYIALNSMESSKEYLGLFTLINAVIHGATTYLISQTKLEDKNLFYWPVGMVIVFVTATIPIQFNDYITAILWAAEAAIIFWYGRTKRINIYELISYIVIFLLFLITAVNWTSVSYNFRAPEIEKLFTPLFNIEFLSSLLVILSFTFIYFVSRTHKTNEKDSSSPEYMFNIIFPLLFLLVIYFTFYTEINLQWRNIQVHASYEMNSNGIWKKLTWVLNSDIFKFRDIWVLNYTLLFASILSLVNFKWLKNKQFNGFIFVLNYL